MFAGCVPSSPSSSLRVVCLYDIFGSLVGHFKRIWIVVCIPSWGDFLLLTCVRCVRIVWFLFGVYDDFSFSVYFRDHVLIRPLVADAHSTAFCIWREWKREIKKGKEGKRATREREAKETEKRIKIKIDQFNFRCEASRGENSEKRQTTKQRDFEHKNTNLKFTGIDMSVGEAYNLSFSITKKGHWGDGWHRIRIHDAYSIRL